MKIIIPMAGTGDRFVMKDYIDPKPLIEVNGKRIISYIYEMFDKNDEFVFICNETHLKTTKMGEIIKTMVPNSEIISIPNHKKGPIFTILDTDIDRIIKDDEEVFLSFFCFFLYFFCHILYKFLLLAVYCRQYSSYIFLQSSELFYIL